MEVSCSRPRSENVMCPRRRMIFSRYRKPGSTMKCLAILVVSIALSCISWSGVGLSKSEPVDRGDRNLFSAIRNRSVREVERLATSSDLTNVRYENPDPHLLSDEDGSYPSFFESFTPLHSLAILPLDGQTSAIPLDSANRTMVEASTLAIASILIRNGANLRAKTRGGETPLDVALAFRNDALAQFLLASYYQDCGVEKEIILPELKDCVPFLPRTLALVFALKCEEFKEVDRDFLLLAAIENADWASALIVLSYVKSQSLNPIFLKRLAILLPNAAPQNEDFKFVESELRRKTLPL